MAPEGFPFPSFFLSFIIAGLFAFPSFGLCSTILQNFPGIFPGGLALPTAEHGKKEMEL